jgi:hypothetical protein
MKSEAFFGLDLFHAFLYQVADPARREQKERNQFGEQ